MKTATIQEANMETQTLIEALKAEGIISNPREKSEVMWWVADGTARFLSFHDGTVTLWQSNRPYLANNQIESMPLEQATVETVAAMVVGISAENRNLSQAW